MIAGVAAAFVVVIAGSFMVGIRVGLSIGHASGHDAGFRAGGGGELSPIDEMDFDEEVDALMESRQLERHPQSSCPI